MKNQTNQNFSLIYEELYIFLILRKHFFADTNICIKFKLGHMLLIKIQISKSYNIRKERLLHIIENSKISTLKLHGNLKIFKIWRICWIPEVNQFNRDYFINYLRQSIDPLSTRLSFVSSKVDQRLVIYFLGHNNYRTQKKQGKAHAMPNSTNSYSRIFNADYCY